MKGIALSRCSRRSRFRHLASKEVTRREPDYASVFQSRGRSLKSRALRVRPSLSADDDVVQFVEDQVAAMTAAVARNFGVKNPWPGLERESNALGGYVCLDCGAMIKGKLTHAHTCSFWDTEEGKGRVPF